MTRLTRGPRRSRSANRNNAYPSRADLTHSPSPRALFPFFLLCSALTTAGAQADHSVAAPVAPQATAPEVRAAALELNWTPLTMPTGERTALLGGSYLVSLGEHWGLGPAVYGAAQGQYGGLFTAGFTLQRRLRLAPHWHAVAGLYAGAGGGVSSDRVRAGGGLMLRPELSLRREFGPWYLGLGVAQVQFPSGNINDTHWALTIGRMDSVTSFSPAGSGLNGRADTRTGMGFDELALSASAETPCGSTRARDGQPMRGRKGKLGADARQYFAPGAWWGLEAAGAASGGIDGYMEILAQLGADVGVFGESVRLGAQIAGGLGGGGNVDTGGGWLLRAGPTLRWITPWGPTLRLEAGVLSAPQGHYTANQLRVSLALPLEPRRRQAQLQGPLDGAVRQQVLYASVPWFSELAFKDGSRDDVTGLGIGIDRDLGGPWYGTAQAGSAALGKAGAFSYGLFGLGLQSQRMAGGWRVGAEALVGAAGGGNVAVGGGGVAQAEGWLQWEGRSRHDRPRVKLGLGRFTPLGDASLSTSLIHLSVGWAFGAMGD